MGACALGGLPGADAFRYRGVRQSRCCHLLAPRALMAGWRSVRTSFSTLPMRDRFTPLQPGRLLPPASLELAYMTGQDKETRRIYEDHWKFRSLSPTKRRFFNGAGRVVTGFITLACTSYRVIISPLLHQAAIWPSGCRFVPTCSRYGACAVRQYGLVRGFMFFLKRLARCHPWAAGGYDPVP